MEITDVRVRKLSEEGRLRSIVSVTLDNCFVIHDIKLIEGENGLFIAMPSKKIADGSFRDIVHPINVRMRQELQEAVLVAYETAKKSAEETENIQVDTYEEQESSL